uniref:TF-B3 domain-containing protein n=1 Tax=Hordeum vulgare subsp. vulgare TaxID=112509 RepID=A0A8I6YDQ2_HORVV
MADLEGFEFFTIILEKSSSRHVLPGNFMKMLDGRRPQNIKLRQADNGLCRLWDMEVLFETDGRMYLDRGWKQLVRAYDLRHGYFIVFRYDDNAMFTVKVFNTTMYRRRYQDHEDASNGSSRSNSGYSKSNSDSGYSKSSSNNGYSKRSSDYGYNKSSSEDEVEQSGEEEEQSRDAEVVVDDGLAMAVADNGLAMVVAEDDLAIVVPEDGHAMVVPEDGNVMVVADDDLAMVVVQDDGLAMVIPQLGDTTMPIVVEEYIS